MAGLALQALASLLGAPGHRDRCGCRPGLVSLCHPASAPEAGPLQNVEGRGGHAPVGWGLGENGVVEPQSVPGPLLDILVSISTMAPPTGSPTNSVGPGSGLSLPQCGLVTQPRPATYSEGRLQAEVLRAGFLSPVTYWREKG